MVNNVRELCRLCANKDDFSKDLLDIKNKNITKIIQDFTQINIEEGDNLPTRICLNCEEKIITFQLFVLECYKVQDQLQQMCQTTTLSLQAEVKKEKTNLNACDIKAEVKDEIEITDEELVSAINENTCIDFCAEDDIDIGDVVEDDDDDDQDDVAIATLKNLKAKNTEKKVPTKEDLSKFSEILKKSNLKVQDFVKMKCITCEDTMKTWNHLRYHCLKKHKENAEVYCICGFLIKSKSVLYKHVAEHKLESRKMQKAEDVKQENDYKNLNISNFIRFTCQTCGREFSSWYSLKKHCERNHDKEAVVNCFCGVTIKSKSTLYKHVQDHQSPNVLCCDKCPKITKSPAAMAKHKMRHVPKSERQFHCSDCDKIFNSKDAIKSHMRSHIPIEERKVYRCDVCDLKFTTRSSAASHKRVVHFKIKSYVCDLCGYACGTNGELRQHRAIHSDDKPFVCNKCSKTFKTYSNLKTHMDTHEDTSYACYVCNRILNSRRTLKKHLLVHEDKCRHVCSYCSKAFKRRQTLKVHMYTHTGDKPISCKWCDERFTYASSLRSHRLRCHPDKISTSVNNFTQHQNTLNIEDDYIQNNLTEIGMRKNEVESMS